MTRWVWFLAALLLYACRSSAPLPALPDVSTGSFLPSIGMAVEKALQEARADPKSSDRSGRLGMVLHAHQILDSAGVCYRRASLLDPKSFEWKYYLGVVSNGEAAVDALRAALRLRDYLPAKLRLGEALLAAGD